LPPVVQGNDLEFEAEYCQWDNPALSSADWERPDGGNGSPAGWLRMPRRFLSQAEWARLSRFPPDIPDNDCIVYFTLTSSDIEAIQQRREAHNRLGFAMQLCALRYLGYFPADIREPPDSVLDDVADQLGLPAEAVMDYALQGETRREHLNEVMRQLGFRRLRAGDRRSLVVWLGERALENERPSKLLQLACERLYQLHIVRPAITPMEELVADARQWPKKRMLWVIPEIGWRGPGAQEGRGLQSVRAFPKESVAELSRVVQMGVHKCHFGDILLKKVFQSRF
jgi:hypothetical protein